MEAQHQLLLPPIWIVLPNPPIACDLGVSIDPSLSFSPHISTIVSKARARCALFLKTFLSRDSKIMVKFFTCYVRPLLELSSPVWSPITSSNINKLENVQRYFTNLINGCTYLPYHQRLSNLSLQSLHQRRIIADLSTLHSLVSGRFNITLSPHLLYIPPSVTRGHNLKIVTPLVHYSSSKQNFLSRTTSLWNDLPLSLIDSTSASFRRRLSKHIHDPFLLSTSSL